MKKLKDAISIPWNLIDGYKSYIGFVITFLAGGLYFTGHLNKEIAEVIAGFGGLIAVTGLRHALQKIIEGLK